jgi:hypothetical protein
MRETRARRPGAKETRISVRLKPAQKALSARRAAAADNDRKTMVGFAYARVAAGQPVPGLIVTANSQSVGSAIDDMMLIEREAD